MRCNTSEASFIGTVSILNLKTLMRQDGKENRLCSSKNKS